MKTLAAKRTKNGQDYFHCFGINIEHRAYYAAGPDEEIWEVEVERDENQDLSTIDWNAIDYFGWVENDSDKIQLIQPNFKLFVIQFPYDVFKYYHGERGLILRLNVNPIKQIL